jgi:mono/diheme cytochrome c family protein
LLPCLALAGCLPDTSPPPPISTEAGVVSLLEAADGDPTQRDELVAAGAKSYRAMGCVTCHAMDATPITGPRLSRLYENPVELAATTPVDADGTPIGDPQRHGDPVWRDRDRPYLWRSIAHPAADVVAGYTGAQRMTHFGHLMDDAEIAGLIAYLESNTRGRRSEAADSPTEPTNEAAGSSPDPGPAGE